MKLQRYRRRSMALVIASLAVGLVLGAPASAQEGTQADEPSEEVVAQLRLGAETYRINCSGCHQAGGIGISGQFPPLKGNPRVQDAGYVRTVLANGLEDAIEVAGVQYEGQMPAFTTLRDDEVEAVIAYIQNDFVVPGGMPVEEPSALPVAGTQLPDLTGMAIIAAFLLAGAVVALVLAPRLIGATNRIDLPWLDAWLKTAVIVVFFIGGTVIVPSFIMQTEIVTDLPREMQDLIGTGLWGGALVLGLVALWWFHREGRI